MFNRVYYSVVADSKAVAAFKISPEPLTSERLFFEHSDLGVDSVSYVALKFLEILLEPPGRLEPISHESRVVAW